MPPSSPTAEPAGAPAAAAARPRRALRPAAARLAAAALLAGLALLAPPAAAEGPAGGTPAPRAAAAPGPAVAAGAAAAAPRAAAGRGRLDRRARALLRELNRVRAAHGRPPLRADRRIARSAAAHARAQARRGALAHGPWQGRIARAAGHPRRVGELIAWRPPAAPAREARAVVRGWLRSPTHRPLLLDPAFRRAGIGRATAAIGGRPAAIHSVGLASAR